MNQTAVKVELGMNMYIYCFILQIHVFLLRRGLLGRETGVQWTSPDQFSMASRGHHPPRVNHDDCGCQFHCCQPVRGNDNRDVPSELRQRPMDVSLADGIQTRSWFWLDQAQHRKHHHSPGGWLGGHDDLKARDWFLM